MIKRPLSKHYPFLFPAIKFFKIKIKNLEYHKEEYSLSYSEEFKLYRVYRSQSPLFRQLGTTDVKFQKAKVRNLELALPHFENLVIKPGHVFSFWNTLGEPSYDRGYVDGMLLADGKVISGVGGGLCQLANIIHWLFLHSGMTIKEHWHHEYDIFPDSGRVIPFGSGAGVLFNYFDLQYLNTTNETYTLNIWLTGKYLMGEIHSDTYQNVKYKIIEEGHRFYAYQGSIYRENKLYKIVIDKRTGDTIDKGIIKANKAKVMYDIENTLILGK